MIARIIVAILLSCSGALAGQGMGPGPGTKGYASGSADYQIASCTIYLAEETGATETRLAVYNSSGTMVGGSSSTTIGTGFPKLLVNTIASGPTLTPGNIYYIAATADGYLSPRAKTNSWQNRSATRGTWPATPATISPTTDNDDSGGEIMMYCSNSSGQVLLGTNSTTAFTETSGWPSSTAVLYYGAGYTCATL